MNRESEATLLYLDFLDGFGNFIFSFNSYNKRVGGSETSVNFKELF